MIIATALAAVLTTAPARLPVQPDAGCLHTPGKETPAQRDRSIAAIAAMRAINTAQSSYSAKNSGKYGRREELAAYLDASRYNLIEGAEIVPGFELTLDRSEKGYWFMITDKTDPCGYRFISNERGLIFAAVPLR